MITIRTARPADLPRLVPLLAGYLAFYRVEYPAARLRRFLRDRLASRPVRIWVAAGSSARTAPLLGFAQVYATWSTLSLAPAWILNDLFVSDTARGKGVGRLLTEAVLEEAARSRVASVELMTAVDNTTARALYDAIGFTAVTDFVTYHRKVAGTPRRQA